MAKKSITEEQEQKRKFWRRHIEQWEKSGSTQAEYCRRHRLSAKSFVYWKGRFRDMCKVNMAAGQKEPVKFVPVEIKPEAHIPAGNSTALVLCKDGYRIEIKESFNPEALGKVIRIIRELSC